jgi:hypothetical protein
MAERYPGKDGRSEYGGGDGTVQRLPDGASLDLPGIASAAGVRAQLMRTAGMADFDPASEDLVGLAATGLDVSKMSAAQRAAYEIDLAVSARRAEERARLNARTNGYISEPDQYVGEEGSGNGVEGFGGGA